MDLPYFFLGGDPGAFLQVCRDEVYTGKDQVPDLPLNATTWASHESLHNPTAHNSPGPAVELQSFILQCGSLSPAALGVGSQSFSW